METLAAFLLLSISLAVLTQSVMQATSQIAGADRLTDARLLAESLMAEAKVEPATTSRNGTTDD